MVDGQPVMGPADGEAPALQEAAADGEPKKKKRERRKHWPALLVRWPRFFWRPREDAKWEDDWPVVERAWLKDYTVLAPDLTVWCEQLEARFRRLDHRAQILQN